LLGTIKGYNDFATPKFSLPRKYQLGAALNRVIPYWGLSVYVQLVAVHLQVSEVFM